MKNVQPDIYEHLRLSKTTGRAIHIKLKNTKGFFITCITDMNAERITINPVSLHGGVLPIISFPESEIEIARCLNVNYDAPFYEHLRMIKANIRLMKEQVKALNKRHR